jgi:hypothetical protein
MNVECRLVLIGVDAPQTVGVFLEVERERGEGPGGPEPHVAIGPGVERRSELRVPALPDRGVGAVRPDHEVGVGEDRGIGHFRLGPHHDTSRTAAPHQQIEQRPP